MPGKKLSALEHGIKAIEKNDLNKAQKKLLAALKNEPNNHLIYYYLAITEFFKKNTHQFFLYCDQYIRLLRKNKKNYSRPINYYYARIFDMMGIYSMKTGEYSEAEAWFKDAIECDAQFFSSFHNYGLLKSEENHPSAVKLFNQALKLARLKQDKAFIYHSLANYHSNQKSKYHAKKAGICYENALKCCKKSHSLYNIILKNRQIYESEF